MDELKDPTQIQLPQPTQISRSLSDVKQVGNGHPTYKPTNFNEQFYFEDNGSLWVNINNIWKEFIPA
jgi:hypothetical protein